MTRTHLNTLVFISAMAAILALTMRFDSAFMILKPLTTILVLLIPILFAMNKTSGLNKMTIFALIACLAGDVFLLDEMYFVYGLSSFLFAQLIFAGMFYVLSNRQFYVLPLFGVLGFGGVSFYHLQPHLAELAIPVGVYTACILLMCWLSICVYLYRKDSIGKLITVGALLFVFSDSVICINKFLFPFELSGLVILSSYWLAIAMIANAIGSLSTLKTQPGKDIDIPLK
jgi:uncharacterized membrane protein YhhN